MRTPSLVFLFLPMLLVAACATSPKPTPLFKPGTVTTEEPEPPRDYTLPNRVYLELVERIKAGAGPETFAEIRDAYVRTEHYQPYLGPEVGDVGAMIRSMNDEAWAACLETSNRILGYNYISLDAHFGAMICAFESGDAGAGEYHRGVLDGLMTAIRSTGDGKTTDSAFETTSTPELQAFIRLQGFEIVSQALMHDEERVYDRMTIKDPEDGREFGWYFDITTQWVIGFRDLE